MANSPEELKPGEALSDADFTRLLSTAKRLVVLSEFVELDNSLLDRKTTEELGREFAPNIRSSIAGDLEIEFDGHEYDTLRGLMPAVLDGGGHLGYVAFFKSEDNGSAEEPECLEDITFEFKRSEGCQTIKATRLTSGSRWMEVLYFGPEEAEELAESFSKIQEQLVSRRAEQSLVD